MEDPTEELELMRSAGAINRMWFNVMLGIGLQRLRIQMRKSVVAIVPVLVGCWLAASVARGVEPIKIVEVRGDGTAMGKAHGEALRDEIKGLKNYLSAYFKTDKERKQSLLASFVFRNQLSTEHQ